MAAGGLPRQVEFQAINIKLQTARSEALTSDVFKVDSHGVINQIHANPPLGDKAQHTDVLTPVSTHWLLGAEAPSLRCSGN